MMEYKGYIGIVEFDDEADIFHGGIVNIRDVITFQGQSVLELKKAFRESIDDYLAFCKARGESPDKPFSGQFVTRISPELHRRVNIAATISGQSLNAFVTEQLQAAVEQMSLSKTVNKKSAPKARSEKSSKAGTSRKKSSQQRA